ncbi:MAG: hypothetical protein QXW48_04510 [Thermoplasmata archaeon]
MSKEIVLKEGLNGEIIEGTSSKTGKPYKAYNIFWINKDGTKTNVKQIFLSDLEIQMLDLLQKGLN